MKLNHLTIYTILWGTVAYVSALLASMLKYNISPNGVLVGLMVAVFSIQGAMAAVSGIFHGSSTLGVLLLVAKLPILGLIALLLVSQGGAFLVSALVGLLAFIPAALMLAFYER